MSSCCRSLQTIGAPVRSTRPMTLESSPADSAMLNVSCCATWASTLPDHAVGRAVRVPGSMSATIALAYPPTAVARRQASTRISRRWRMRTMALLTPTQHLQHARQAADVFFLPPPFGEVAFACRETRSTWPPSPSNTSMLRSSQR